MLLNVFRDEGEDINEFDKLLQQAANFSKEGKLKVICPNPDTIIPYNNDNRYCPGYFAKKITNLNADVIFTGKPHIEIYNELLKTIPNVSKDLILMIGDTLDTDILGANRAGIHSALVMTGNSRKYYNTKDSLQLQLQQITQKAKDDGMIPNFVIDISIKD